MSKLILLRHATAMGHHTEGDFNRSLSQEGQHEAQIAANQIEGLVGQLAVTLAVSQARRTLQTAQTVSAHIPATTLYYPELYNATADTIIKVGTDLLANQTAQIVIVVGHNPGISEAASQLLGHEVNMHPAMVIEVDEHHLKDYLN